MRRIAIVLLSLGVFAGYGSAIAHAGRYARGEGRGCHGWQSQYDRGFEDGVNSRAAPAAVPQAPAPAAAPQTVIVQPQAAPAPVYIVMPQGSAPSPQTIVLQPQAAPPQAAPVATPVVAPSTAPVAK